MLLLETGAVLALPAWGAFRLGRELRMSWRLAIWQTAYWVFFVAAMVIGLLPGVTRD